MATQVDIISNSLALLGHAAITTLSDPDEITTAAIQAYDMLLPGVLSRNNWRFAVKIADIYREEYLITSAALTVVTTGTNSNFSTTEPQTVRFETEGTIPTSTPQIDVTTTYYAVGVTATTFNVYETYQNAINAVSAISFLDGGVGTNKVVKVANPESAWKSIYPLPTDYLKLIRMYPQNYQFEIYVDKVYATGDDSYLTLEYVYQPDATVLPSRFVEYFVYEIAAYLALSNAQRPDYYNVLEAKRQQSFAMAAAIEAQNRPNYSQASFPVLDSRNVTLLDLPNSLG